MSRYRTQLTQREIGALERTPENVRQERHSDWIERRITNELAGDAPRDPHRYYKRKREILDQLDRVLPRRNSGE